jgi:hypothetical protein
VPTLTLECFKTLYILFLRLFFAREKWLILKMVLVAKSGKPSRSDKIKRYLYSYVQSRRPVSLPRFGGSSATSVLWMQPLFVNKEETNILQFINSSKVIIITNASIFSPWICYSGGQCGWNQSMHFSQFYQPNSSVPDLSSVFYTSS